MTYRLLAWLPLPVLYVLARIAYVLLYYVAGYRKAVVLDNLRSAFPEKSGIEITLLAKKFYRQLSDVAVEVVKTGRMSQADFRRRVRVVNPELVEHCSNGFSEPLIILTIHQGNWEWMLHGTSASLGVPLDPLYKPLHNKSADRAIFDLRSRFGSRPLAMEHATRELLRHRRDFRLWVMVADQSPIRRERSYWTTFLNREAAFYQGAETIAENAGFPVLFAQCRRRARGYYDIEFHQLDKPVHEGESQRITERYVRMAEQAIREEPQSWLWSNRRWKRDRASEENA